MQKLILASAFASRFRGPRREPVPNCMEGPGTARR